MSIRLIGLLTAGISLLAAPGCVGLGTYLEDLGQTLQAKQQYHQEAHEARRSERHAAHQAKLACKHQDLAQLEAETIPQLRTDLRTRLVHRIEMDQPTVDVEQLKALMAKVEEQNKPIRELRAQLEAEARRVYVQQQQNYMRAMLGKISGEKDCCMRLPPCPPPDLPAQLPPERALLPTEIPLVFRARLQLNVEESSFQEAEIERVPSLPARLPECAPTCDCPDCAAKGGFAPAGIDGMRAPLPIPDLNPFPAPGPP